MGMVDRRGAGVLAGALLAVAVLTGCRGTTARPAAAGSRTPSAVASVTAAPSGPSPSPPATAVPEFTATTSAVTAADVPHTWHAGCPVGPPQLAMLRLSYWGFDGAPHQGTIVVNRAVASDVRTIFATLYRERFPIRQMVPEDAFGGSDPASMAADNTSGFNCRYAVAPGPPQWSAHAYGEAIDVNTVENPYLEGGTVMPSAGQAYLNRATVRPGMAVRGGVLVDAFAAAGWQWGGRWGSSPDYQHFSRNGS